MFAITIPLNYINKASSGDPIFLLILSFPCTQVVSHSFVSTMCLQTCSWVHFHEYEYRIMYSSTSTTTVCAQLRVISSYCEKNSSFQSDRSWVVACNLFEGYNKHLHDTMELYAPVKNAHHAAKSLRRDLDTINGHQIGSCECGCQTMTGIEFARIQVQCTNRVGGQMARQQVTETPFQINAALIQIQQSCLVMILHVEGTFSSTTKDGKKNCLPTYK